ncbi:hypothetical protein DJ71_27675 [Halorubrum sp. E3]|uniref:DUF5518 domain-containing protein n=1 Tax=Halorubrum distributum TaxID=29283 RepID=UPI000BCD770B|nr:DUF5518 domain-containing protein [Halorubrum distributum]MDV7351152.1 DUF5518 domain-containing protein [Halorubrum distributum]OYR53407.1 hypothetical protein DJ71_27675 [Halorubrum sp. E3]OYR82114.1 hypothetical protein DJ72_09740 [Halorubrum distributum]
MSSNTQGRRISQPWHVAILGTIAALPATVVINWLPNSEATAGGGVMIVGSMIAGGIAAKRSVDPSAAGLRAGFLGGVVAVSGFILTEATAVAWTLNTIVFFLIAAGMLLCFSPVFGLIFARIGGWAANTVGGFGADQAS